MTAKKGSPSRDEMNGRRAKQKEERTRMPIHYYYILDCLLLPSIIITCERNPIDLPCNKVMEEREWGMKGERGCFCMD